MQCGIALGILGNLNWQLSGAKGPHGSHGKSVAATVLGVVMPGTSPTRVYHDPILKIFWDCVCI